jgi:hypothetical protein
LVPADNTDNTDIGEHWTLLVRGLPAQQARLPASRMPAEKAESSCDATILCAAHKFFLTLS